MKELAFASIRELQKKIDDKEISPHELVSYFKERFTKYDTKVNAALEVFDVESTLHRSKDTGPLVGIPGIIKDNICQARRALTCGSKILEHYNAPYDATAIARLKNVGAPLIGRANMDEFAMGSSTETSAFKKTKNPWALERVPGGSSGGSAAAVAAGFVPWALGSDTGGSIRQPATFCGLVGLKPTYGLVSRYGLVAYASSLDQIGPMTRTVYDNALLFSFIAGHDEKDSTSIAQKPQDYTKPLTGKLKEGFTLGVVDNALEAAGFDKEVYALLYEALKIFEKLGARIKQVKLPTMDYGAAAYFMISRAEAASNMARFDGVRYGYRSKNSQTLSQMYSQTRNEGFGLEVKSRIIIGNYVLSVGHADRFYNSAKVVQGLIRDEFVQTFKDVDLLFMPGAPVPAYKFGAFGTDSLAMDLQDYFTASSNLTGMPALSVPCGFTQDMMPVGFQLLGPDLSEAEIFKAAYAYEQETQFSTRHPKEFE